MKLIFVMIAAGVGMLLPLQAGFNAEFASRSGHGLHGAIWNFILGFLLLSILLALFALTGALPKPDLESLKQGPWWAWAGGACGVAVVISGLTLFPRIGPLLLLSSFVAGQIVSSLVVDHFALVGAARREINAGRLGGALLVIGGVALIYFATPHNNNKAAAPTSGAVMNADEPAQ